MKTWKEKLTMELVLDFINQMEFQKNPKELVPRKHQYIQDIMKNYKV